MQQLEQLGHIVEKRERKAKREASENALNAGRCEEAKQSMERRTDKTYIQQQNIHNKTRQKQSKSKIKEKEDGNIDAKAEGKK